MTLKLHLAVRVRNLVIVVRLNERAFWRAWGIWLRCGLKRDNATDLNPVRRTDSIGRYTTCSGPQQLYCISREPCGGALALIQWHAVAQTLAMAYSLVLVTACTLSTVTLLSTD